MGRQELQGPWQIWQHHAAGKSLLPLIFLSYTLTPENIVGSIPHS